MGAGEALLPEYLAPLLALDDRLVVEMGKGRAHSK
jgi:hypothetical protein